MPKKVSLEKWLEKHGKQSSDMVVTPFENSGRMDDPAALDQRKSYRDQKGEPVIHIQTVTNADMKKINGSEPEAKPQIIRVNSPGLTTQPILSFERRDLDGSEPSIRVLEGGKGVPDIRPFVNPYTSTNPLSTSSLLAPSASDSKGHSITNNYDELRKRMGNAIVNLNGEQLDILLPVNVDESCTRISIGGVAGTLRVKSAEAKKNDYDSDRKVGEKRRTRPLNWDGSEDRSD